MTRVFSVLSLLVVIACSAIASADVQTQDLTLYVGEQQTFTPGYAVGDIQVLNPEVANFRVQSGARREIMLVGKGKGETQLIIWDQKRVKRHEIKLIVRSREDLKAEADLKDLLKDFPTVQVRRLGDKLVVSGTVSSQSDLDAVGRIASVAAAENLVRVVRGGYPGASPGGTTTPTPDPGAAGATGTPTPGAPSTTAPAAAPQIEYEVEVLEANIAFQSGTYGKGIEPSGPSLYKKVVRAAIGTDVDVMVPGSAVTAKSSGSDKDRKNDKNAPAAASATSLRMRLRPTGISEDGQLTTYVVIETNLPVEGAKDPSVNRRARWELVGATDEPFGLAGAELMAMPQVAQNPSRLGRVLSTGSQVVGMPGVSGRAGTNYVPSYVPYYDKSKNTQLLAVFRPRIVAK
jgi:hypothetical protein